MKTKEERKFMKALLFLIFALPVLCYSSDLKKVLIKGPAAKDLHSSNIFTQNVRCYEVEVRKPSRNRTRSFETVCELKVTDTYNTSIDDSDDCPSCRPRTGIRN